MFGQLFNIEHDAVNHWFSVITGKQLKEFIKDDSYYHKGINDELAKHGHDVCLIEGFGNFSPSIVFNERGIPKYIVGQIRVKAVFGYSIQFVSTDISGQFKEDLLNFYKKFE